MTLDEAKKITEANHHDYHDFTNQPFCVDGHYTLEQLEALLILARDAAAKEAAA